jgi:hypothetical protein
LRFNTLGWNVLFMAYFLKLACYLQRAGDFKEYPVPDQSKIFTRKQITRK